MKLGDEVKDKLTGSVGILTGRAEYLYGCVQVLISPREAKDGKPQDAYWLDEDRVELGDVRRGMPRPASAAERAGGPVPNPAPIR